MRLVMGAFACARYAVFGFALLTVASMSFYPGGNYRDRNSLGYHFFQNFLSDLGMPQSWSGQSNQVGALLFVTGEVLLAIGVIAFGVGVVRLSSSVYAARILGRLAAVAGIVAAFAIVMTAFTPANQFFAAHVAAALIGSCGGAVGAALLAIAMTQDGRSPHLGVLVATLLCAVLATYAGIIKWGPAVSGDYGLRVQVTAQKLMFVVSLSSIVYLTLVGERLSMEATRRQSATESFGSSIR